MTIQIFALVASMLWLPVARAESRLFPLQGDAMLDYSVGSHVDTATLHISVTYVRPFTPTYRGWRMFGGVSAAASLLGYWKRDERLARDAFQAASPGLEARIGLVYGGRFGSPRLLMRVMPTWAPGVNEMGFPSDRGPAVRLGVGVACPSWLLGLLSTDDEDLQPIAWVAYAFAILVPTQIEYVYQHVPGDDRHGLALGWSF